MRLRLENNAGTYDLSDNFKMSISPFKRRTGLAKRYGKDGAKSMGDGRADSRTIFLEYNNKQPQDGTRAEKDAAYRTTLNNISSFFDPTFSPYYIYDIDNNIRTEIVMDENSDDPIATGMVYIVGKNGLRLDMLDGHWEDSDENTFSQSGALTTNDTFIINNDSLFTCWPIFTFVATNSNTEFVLTNSTTGESFTLSNNSFTIGATFVVDGINGQVLLSDVESSISLGDGSGFISLAPGENSFIYESAVGGECTFSVAYRRRYAH